jgi:REP element-mobilizing transposase RayT
MRRDVPSLRSELCRSVLRSCFAAARRRDDFRLANYSIQGNHLHFVVEADDSRALSRAMQGIGTRMARQLNRATGRKGALLAERYRTKELKTPREVRNCLAYVLLNSRHHDWERGALWIDWEIDPCSSGLEFDGWGTSRAPPVVLERTTTAAPRSWLLRVGWRRWGLIDPAEVPGKRR